MVHLFPSDFPSTIMGNLQRGPSFARQFLQSGSLGAGVGVGWRVSGALEELELVLLPLLAEDPLLSPDEALLSTDEALLSADEALLSADEALLSADEELESSSRPPRSRPSAICRRADATCRRPSAIYRRPSAMCWRADATCPRRLCLSNTCFQRDPPTCRP